MNDPLPLISVIMPAYNAEPYIGEAIASVLSQSERRLELIVVDDGSTDASAKVAEAMAAADSRVNVVRLPHAGNVPAANEGIRRARGEFIAKMDADDICLPSRFADQVEHLRRHPRTVGVGGAVIELTAEGPGTPIQWPPHRTYDPARLHEWVGMPGPGATMRADAVRQVGGFRGAFALGQDADLWHRLLEIGDIDNLTVPILHYRRHPFQVSNRFAPLQELSGETARALAYARADGGEPDWAADVPLTPTSVADLAEKCTPRAATALHIGLARYFVRLEDGPSARAHFLEALAGDSGIVGTQDFFEILWRVGTRLSRLGHRSLRWRLAATHPSGLVGGARQRLHVWRQYPISPKLMARLGVRQQQRLRP